MPDPRHDLLHDPLFHTEHQGTACTYTLPGLLASLSRGEALEFSRLRPHQQHPWHAFLCQLGALASHHRLNRQFPEEEGPWCEALVALGGGLREPWCLVVDDLSKPAFFQPPVPEGSLQKFSEIATPDELDVLVTSKNHDVKLAPSRAPSPEHWIFALLTLQTFQGYSGRGNQGIARMNGGYGSRPHVGYVLEDSSGSRFLRDTALLLEERDRLLEDHGYAETGLALLWKKPWDGNETLSLEHLDPFFIEICRRVRFVSRGTALQVLGSPCEVPRVDAKQQKGNLGDLWTPLKEKDKEAISIPAAGFHYTRVQDLLFEQGHIAPPAQRLPDSSAPFFWLGQVLSRGQGSTEGYHERLIPIPPRVRGLLSRGDERARLGLLAKERVTRAGDARLKLLSQALRMLLQGGPEKLNHEDKRPARWLEQLDREIDQIFFERLWSDLALSPEEADRRWNQKLVDLAWGLLQQATREAPVPVARRFRAIAEAERYFRALAHKFFGTQPSHPRTPDERSHNPSSPDPHAGTQGTSRPGGSARSGDPPPEPEQPRRRRGAAEAPASQPLLPGFLEADAGLPEPPGAPPSPGR